MRNTENKFEYTYSAPRNAEIEKIRKKYIPKSSSETKLEQIKRLDSSVEGTALACALGTGILGSLILGTGMCCTMIWHGAFAAGIIVGIIGMIMCGCAYPIYKSTIKRKRAEIAPQILKLSDEIEKGINN